MSLCRAPGAAPLFLVAVLSLGGPACAQTVYQWVDERGVVHFEQAPPRHPSQDVRTRKLGSGTAPAAKGAGPSAREEKDSGGTEGELYGAADLRVAKQEVARIGPSGREVKGRVKNQGDGVAHNATVTIVVIDTDQNGPCFEQVARVDPPELGPGQEGEFLAELEHPCFYGNTRVEVRPEWN